MAASNGAPALGPPVPDGPQTPAVLLPVRPATALGTAGPPAAALVVMGVSGCGKSSVGRACAERLGCLFVEGDDFHPPHNMAKMRAGVALTDGDRDAWLAVLARQIAFHRPPPPMVLACSALKKSYRDRLRNAAAGVRFLYLELNKEEATRRVSRRVGHVFPQSLVASQFTTLQSPQGEPGVLAVDATWPVETIVEKAVRWLQAGGAGQLLLQTVRGVR